MVGTVLIAASWWAGGAAGWSYLGASGFAGATAAFFAGASMIFSGVASMLTPTPKMNGGGGLGKETEKKSSTSFSNTVNMVAQEHPVPLTYGEILTGSLVISKGTKTFKADKVQFGDGYIQRASKGINNTLREFTVNYRSTWGVKMQNGKIVPVDTEALDELTEVEEFLKRHKGYKSFLWASYRKPNQGAPVKVVCESWTIDRQQGYGSINMTFKETL